jgi:hypothetical protein
VRRLETEQQAHADLDATYEDIVFQKLRVGAKPRGGMYMKGKKV